MEEQKNPHQDETPAVRQAADKSYATADTQFESGRLIAFLVVAALILVGAVVLSKLM